MNEEELKKLIEKYYNGESTEEDERALRDYFTNDKVTEGYLTEEIIFRFYTASEEVPEPSHDFESRILSGIDAVVEKKSSEIFSKRYYQLIGAAAGLLILLGSYFLFNRKAEQADTFSDPVIAYSETIKILMQVSSQLNHGAQALEQVSKINEMTTKSFESIHKSTKIVEKSLKNLDYFQIATDIIHSPVEKNINK
jgi:hypothetical protein